VQWLIAALNSVEPAIANVATLIFHEGEEWAKSRRPSATAFAKHRLASLAAALGDKPYLDGERFTAGDLMMASVLRIKPELNEDPRLKAYVERCTARPAFQRALAAHLGDFSDAA
jgi:glutathione S-transferase